MSDNYRREFKSTNGVEVEVSIDEGCVQLWLDGEPDVSWGGSKAMADLSPVGAQLLAEALLTAAHRIAHPERP